MRRERELPEELNPSGSFKVRVLDDSATPKSMVVPITWFYKTNPYGGFVGADYEPGTPTSYIFYVCDETGTYTNFGNVAASKFDQFHWNTGTESWDLIPYSEGLELDKQSDGGKWITEDGVLKLVYWTGSAWAETGTEVPLP